MAFYDTFRSVLLGCGGALLLALASGLPAQAQPHATAAEQQQPVPPPKPILPIPTERQLKWQEKEMDLFLHFTVNTFTDREWGDGTESPDVFTPADFDARQWARVARETGFKTVILTAKHHDGFALWPSRYTDHTVASSPWKNGDGDVVQALADAARAEGIDLGLYLSPWDRHEPTYGQEQAYNQFYLGQLRELLTEYGALSEVWFDGAKGEDAEDMDYNFDTYWALVRQLQPGAVLFSDIGPDVRWIGNEDGFAGETNWSMMDTTGQGIGAADSDYLNTGDPQGAHWIPGECDVSIRDGWFWHPDEAPKALDALMEIYYKSVGRNCKLLLNVPPDDRGRLPEADVEQLRAFKETIDTLYATDRAAGQDAAASNVRGGAARFGAGQALDGDAATYWATEDSLRSATLEVDLGAPATFDVARIEEPIRMGQRVKAYRVEAWQDGAWQTVSQGTTVGYRKLDRLDEPVTARRVRLVVDDARAAPLVSAFGLHVDPRADAPPAGGR